MGLDQYAYSVNSNGEREDLAYWRKHPNLQGWMQDLWEEKGRPGLTEENSGNIMGDFNCIPLELTREDINDLEDAILNNILPKTTGFFFGEDKDDHYREQDLEFVRKAREALDSGLTVMYDSWW